jgi:hypothetical protein
MMNQTTREQLFQEVKESLSQINAQVFYLLEQYPETRGNDTLLIYHWLETFKGVDSLKDLFQLAVTNSVSFESVRRSRQKIQHLGFFLPDDPVILKRRKLEQIHRMIQAERGELS